MLNSQQVDRSCRCRNARDGRKTALRWVIVCLGVIVCNWFGSRPALGQQAVAQEIAGPPVINRTREYNVKGVYLFNFARFVTWAQPELNALEQMDEFRIGILGQSPIVAPLRKVQAKRKITDKQRNVKLPIRLLEFESIERIKDCEILFVSAKISPSDIARVIERMRNTQTLVVGESDGFVDAGGTAGFTLVNNGIKFDLNLADAQLKQLSFNAQLLQAANRIVPVNQQQVSSPN